MENILNGIKSLLGIEETDLNFNREIVMHINSALNKLNQLGIGSEDGFKIFTGGEVWEDFIDDRLDLEMIKSYVYLNVRLLFDPPQISFLVSAIQTEISELAWRLQLQAEPYTLTAEEAAEESEE